MFHRAPSQWLRDHGYEGAEARKILRLWRALDGPYRAAVNGNGAGDADSDEDSDV